MEIKQARSKVERRVRLFPTTGRLMEIRIGKEISWYWVTALDAGCQGKAFRMRKLVGGTEHDYDVLLAGPESSCECRGFLRWGMGRDGRGCRHIAALQALLNAGKL